MFTYLLCACRASCASVCVKGQFFLCVCERPVVPLCVLREWPVVPLCVKGQLCLSVREGPVVHLCVKGQLCLFA